MKKIIKIYEEAPPIGKILLIVIGAIILYLVYKAAKKLLTPKSSNENLVDASKDELKELEKIGEKVNYSKSQFAGFADSLEQAMSGVGTDEDSIKETFAYMQNKSDVLELIKTFGIRNYEDDKLLMYNIKPFNLNQWLAVELDASDINELVNKQLKSKNINYTF